jgi:outer membrane protein TolC
LLVVAFRLFADGLADRLDSIQSANNLSVFNQQLDVIIKETLSQNHSLKAAAAKIDQTDASARSKSAYSPPRIEIGAMDASLKSFPNPFADQMNMDYSLEQMIMFPGKLSKMKKAELKRKEMVQYDKKKIESELILKVKSAFYGIYLIDRQLAINNTSQTLVSSIIDIARTRYEVGTGKQVDILSAQTELSIIRKSVAVLEQQRMSMSSMINALRNRPVDTPIETIPEIVPHQFNVTYDELQKKALENKSDLKSMVANVEMKQIEKAASRMEWFPDFIIKGTYSDVRPVSASNDPMNAEFGITTSATNPDRWSIMVGLTIPEVPWYWKKISAGQQQTKSAVIAAEEELAEVKNMIMSDVYSVSAEIQSNQRQMYVIMSMQLPQAQMALESAFASYQTGSEEFTMLFGAHRTLLMTRGDYHMAVVNFLTSIAKVEQIIGIGLE